MLYSSRKILYANISGSFFTSSIFEIQTKPIHFLLNNLLSVRCVLTFKISILLTKAACPTALYLHSLSPFLFYFGKDTGFQETGSSVALWLYLKFLLLFSKQTTLHFILSFLLFLCTNISHSPCTVIKFRPAALSSPLSINMSITSSSNFIILHKITKDYHFLINLSLPSFYILLLAWAGKFQ